MYKSNEWSSRTRPQTFLFNNKVYHLLELITASKIPPNLSFVASARYDRLRHHLPHSVAVAGMIEEYTTCKVIRETARVIRLRNESVQKALYVRWV
jgi:hypothetical protein